VRAGEAEALEAVVGPHAYADDSQWVIRCVESAIESRFNGMCRISGSTAVTFIAGP